MGWLLTLSRLRFQQQLSLLLQHIEMSLELRVFVHDSSGAVDDADLNCWRQQLVVLFPFDWTSQKSVISLAFLSALKMRGSYKQWYCIDLEGKAEKSERGKRDI